MSDARKNRRRKARAHKRREGGRESEMSEARWKDAAVRLANLMDDMDTMSDVLKNDAAFGRWAYGALRLRHQLIRFDEDSGEPSLVPCDDLPCPECNGPGEVPTEDREWVECAMCYVPEPTRAERQVAAVREVIADMEARAAKYQGTTTVYYKDGVRETAAGFARRLLHALETE